MQTEFVGVELKKENELLEVLQTESFDPVWRSVCLQMDNSEICWDKSPTLIAF